jgi:hypothetical protein
MTAPSAFVPRAGSDWETRVSTCQAAEIALLERALSLPLRERRATVSSCLSSEKAGLFLRMNEFFHFAPTLTKLSWGQVVTKRQHIHEPIKRCSAVRLAKLAICSALGRETSASSLTEQLRIGFVFGRSAISKEKDETWRSARSRAEGKPLR